MSFGHTKHYFKHAVVITNGKVKGILADMKLVGGAICLEKSDCVARVLLKARDLHALALRDFLHEVSGGTLMQFLARKRRCLYKALFAEKSKEILL